MPICAQAAWSAKVSLAPSHRLTRNHTAAGKVGSTNWPTGWTNRRTNVNEPLGDMVDHHWPPKSQLQPRRQWHFAIPFVRRSSFSDFTQRRRHSDLQHECHKFPDHGQASQTILFYSEGRSTQKKLHRMIPNACIELATFRICHKNHASFLLQI